MYHGKMFKKNSAFTLNTTTFKTMYIASKIVYYKSTSIDSIRNKNRKLIVLYLTEIPNVK